MKVLMSKSVAVRGGVYTLGQEVDVPDDIARSWVASKTAEAVTEEQGDGLEDLTASELRDHAAEQGVASYGSKAQIIARIREA